MQFEGRRKRVMGADLTPLIDVLFLLIVFFVLSSSFQKIRKVGLDVPESTAVARPEHKALVVSIDAEGAYHVDGVPVDSNSVIESVKAQLEPERAVLVESGGSVQVETLVQLLDRLRDAGATDIGIATKVTSQP